MTDKEYLDRACEYIAEQDGGSRICDLLHDIPNERDFCEENCENLDRFCVLRYLKYYKNER